MFKDITKRMKARMDYLESIDKRDRTDGTQKEFRLRQIPPETGRFLALLASSCPSGDYVEIGTSAGYSTMWLSLAAKEKRAKIKTYEISAYKIKLAKETFDLSGINDYVDLIEGDAIKNISSLGEIAFCFIDCEKEMYGKCWDILSAKMVPGGLIVADNALSHYDVVKPMIEKAANDDKFDCLLVPIGKGELVCRRKSV